EDDKLRDAVSRHGERNWKSIAEEVPGRNHTQCLQRWTKVLAPGLVKGHWRPDEDDLLKELVAEGRKNWGQVATRIPGRTSKQCRERWYNHLDPSIVRGYVMSLLDMMLSMPEYTAEEDRTILDAQSRLGNRWSAIAAMLPGRTEDAVKIRWKSLCRVRKGYAEKGKMTPKGMMSMQGMPGQMMQHRPGFNGGLVKSEEVGAFSMHQPQGTQMMRLANGQVVPASSMQAGGQQHPGMGMMGGMGGAMMYTNDMSGGGYDPTMVHYRKPPMQQQHLVTNGYGHSLPPTVPIPDTNPQDFAVDRRANMVSISSNGMPVPSQTQEAYRQAFEDQQAAYAGGMYSTGPSTPNGGMNNGQMYGASPQMNAYRPGGALLAPQLSPHQPQHPSMMHSPHHQPQMMSYNYGLPPTPTAGGMGGGVSVNHSMLPTNGGMNPAAAFVQQQQYAEHTPSPLVHHQQNQQQHMQQHMPVHEQDQPHPEKEPRSPQQEQAKQASDNLAGAPLKGEQGRGPTLSFQAPSGQAAPNPAALFARSQAAKAPPAVNGANPVAAFLQQQQQKRKEPNDASKLSASAPKPFNPAAAFAQRFQAMQKPPTMPSTSSNGGGSTKSNDDTADEDEDGGNGNGGDKSNEPSLKKVKPRLSIDAARASAARRLRNSGSGGNLAGRGSLDVFLNEIGDVGRLSDLKMDEFQTLEELWRVSGDMDRLSGEEAGEADERGGPMTLEQLKLRVLARTKPFLVLNKGADERMDGAFDVTIEKAKEYLAVVRGHLPFDPADSVGNDGRAVKACTFSKLGLLIQDMEELERLKNQQRGSRAHQKMREYPRGPRHGPNLFQMEQARLLRESTGGRPVPRDELDDVTAGTRGRELTAAELAFTKLTWHDLANEEKEAYTQQAKADKARFLREFALFLGKEKVKLAGKRKYECLDRDVDDKGEQSKQQEPVAYIFDAPIVEPHRSAGVFRMHVGDDRNASGKTSTTIAFVLGHGMDKNQPVTKVLLRPLNGRRHQLRLHLAHHGFPIAGDVTYGSQEDDAPRMMLHAWKIWLRGRPQDQEYGDLYFTSPDPFESIVSSQREVSTITYHKHKQAEAEALAATQSAEQSA
ncbi:hypothetical protein BBJ28_00011971, partial [Nothophytophthora sp. Chile5]